MIISLRDDKNKNEFEGLLSKSYDIIKNEAQIKSDYFIKRSATEFEKDVYSCLCEAAKNTDFDKTIELISGHKFPDIIIKKFYGIEVKTTKQNHWKSTGNSVLESTRVNDVDRIYIFFAKLTNPLGFKYRLYQECLYDVAVTHSPRYLINMDLECGQSIFDKIGTKYDELRNKPSPIKPIIAYYRSICKSGEEPWWMDNTDSQENLLKPIVSQWCHLDKTGKQELKNQAMARFPEMFGTSRNKYQKIASWLAARHGIVDSSLRDRFSAGGKVDLKIKNKTYKNFPRIFSHLKNNYIEIVEEVKKLSPDEAKFYWSLSSKPKAEQLLSMWKDKLTCFSKQQIKEAEELIDNLLTSI